MKRTQRRARVQRSASPKVEIRRSPFYDPYGDDWYGPKVPGLVPQEVFVSLGEKRKGRVRCVIGEGEWERRHASFTLILDPHRMIGERFNVNDIHSKPNDPDGDGFVATMQLEHMDRLITVLTRARDEAKRLGFFTPRPTPGSIEDVAAVLSTRREAR